MNGDPAQKDLYDEINELRSDYRLVASKLDGLTSAVDALTRSRQFSWPAMLSAGAALVVFGGVVWSAVQMSIKLEVEPLKQELVMGQTIRDEMRIDSLDNKARIANLETSLEGFIRETKAKEIEVETQFEGMGETINLRMLDNLKAHCRIAPAECTSLQYWPDSGRMVSNGKD